MSVLLTSLKHVFFYANKVLHPSSSLITSLVVGRSSGFVLTNRLMSLRKVRSDTCLI